MKRFNQNFGVLIMIIAFLIPPMTSCTKSHDMGNQANPDASESAGDKSVNNQSPSLFSDDEALLFMREEEKMARDVYTYLSEKWDLKVFENISKSEQVHMDRVLDLLDHYGLEDPALPGYGEFTNPVIQELYTNLISSGDSSIANALVVGATIEEIDIVDLQTFIEATDDEYIQCIFGNLMRASRNHLRAFYHHLELREIDYTPQYLNLDEFTAIVDGPHEAGGTPCNQ